MCFTRSSNLGSGGLPLSSVALNMHADLRHGTMPIAPPRIAKSTVEAVGRRIDALRRFGYPETEILGEASYSQTPLR